MCGIPRFWAAAAALSGRLRLHHLLEHGPPPDQWPGLTVPELVRYGLPLHYADLLAHGAGGDQAINAARSTDAMLTLADPRYPRCLLELDCPPPVLFYRGQTDQLRRPAAAVVGTRQCTQTGRRMASLLARGVVLAGGTVVSGLARGIDCAAHEAASGATIAVLGHGLDHPPGGSRTALMNQIIREGGLVLSEFLPWTPPGRYTFPQRNRIIAALARVTVVVEAGLRSGARITARDAIDLGREVMAVPGHPLHEQTAGCLALLNDGAGLALDSACVVEAMGLQPRGPTLPATDPLVRALGQGATLDELHERTGRPIIDLLRALSALELTGMVHRLPGDVYVQRRPS